MTQLKTLKSGEQNASKRPPTPKNTPVNTARENLITTRMNRQAAVLQDPKSWSSLRWKIWMIQWGESSHQNLDFRAKLLNARTWDALKTTRVIVCGNEYTTLKLLGKVNTVLVCLWFNKIQGISTPQVVWNGVKSSILFIYCRSTTFSSHLHTTWGPPLRDSL